MVWSELLTNLFVESINDLFVNVWLSVVPTTEPVGAFCNERILILDGWISIETSVVFDFNETLLVLAVKPLNLKSAPNFVPIIAVPPNELYVSELAPLTGDCQLAEIADVAVKTWPVVGGGAKFVKTF